MVVFMLFCLLQSSGALANDSGEARDSHSGKLALLINQLYGPDGLFVDSEALLPSGQTHSAHFNSSFQQEFFQLNIAIANQLSSVPLPSPASGFTYTFDSKTGVFSRSTSTFGPILSERAETVGKNMVTFGFSVQSFGYDTIEGSSLSGLPAVFTHDGAQAGGKADVVTTSNSIDARMDQFTTFLTWGVTDSLDLSIGVPLVSTSLDIVSEATVQRLGTLDLKAVHFFDDDGEFGDQRRFSASGSATGLGDILVRLKKRTESMGPADIALSLDLRLPTGDEANLLGSGAFGVRPNFILSLSGETVSPYFNLNYQWNGKSLLMGDLLTGQKEDMPDQMSYTAGLDIGVHDKLSMAVEIRGRRAFDTPRLFPQTFYGLDSERTLFPNIHLERDSFNMFNGGIGFKFNPGTNFLVNFNLLFRLDDDGVRDTLTPMIGMDYAF